MLPGCQFPLSFFPFPWKDGESLGISWKRLLREFYLDTWSIPGLSRLRSAKNSRRPPGQGGRRVWGYFCENILARPTPSDTLLPLPANCRHCGVRSEGGNFWKGFVGFPRRSSTGCNSWPPNWLNLATSVNINPTWGCTTWRVTWNFWGDFFEHKHKASISWF